MLVTCKSLNVLQRRQGFLHPLNRLRRHLSRLAQSDMHAVLRVRCRSKEAFAMSLSEPPSAALRHHAQDYEPPSAALCPQTGQTQAPIHSAFVASEPVTLHQPARPQ